MRRTLQRSALVAAALGAGVSALPATAAAAPACGPATAARLEKRLPVTPFNLGRRIGQTKCFDFTADGRTDIVFTGWEFMNHGAHYWAAYRATRTNWIRVKFKRSCCRSNPRYGKGIQIRRSGRNIVVREPVYRSADPACCPTGGTRTGTWRWLRNVLGLIGVERDPGET